MKPQINNKRKFNLDKQLVQKLDSNKLAQVKAGNAEEAGTTFWLSLIAGATVATTGTAGVTVVVGCTIIDNAK